MSLIFATNNHKKVEEIRSKLPDLRFLTLNEFGVMEDIPETSPTIEGNASQKSTYLFENYNVDCFADDTGLEIEALNGEPGVYSARYAGEERNADANMNLVLTKLADKQNRKAQFKTVISLIIKGEEHQFTGIIKGEIIKEKRGTNGFGYDPIFVPEGYTETFAELSLDIKNKISHRALAVDKLVAFLNESNS